MRKIDIKKLRLDIKELEKKRDEAKQRVIYLINDLKNSKEWKDLEAKRVSANALKNELDKKIEKIKKRVSEQFITQTHSWESPYYRKSEWGGGLDTNIFDEVFEAIKMHLRISKLRQSDIEKLVSSLIQKGLSKTKYFEHEKKAEEMRDEDNWLRDRQKALESEQISIAEEEERFCNIKIRRCEDMIKNPEKYENRSDKEEERLKVDDDKIITKIYNDYRNIEMEDFE